MLRIVYHILCNFRKNEIREGVESVYAADSIPAHQRPELHMTLLNHFETYYRDMSSMYRGRSQLPVWKSNGE